MRSQHGVEAEVCVADLSSPADVRRVEVLLDDPARPIDLLVNNAGGHTRIARFIDHDVEHLDSEAFLNAFAVFRLTHAAVRNLVGRGHGNVIQISAGVAHYPAPKSAVYAASKAFVNSLSEAVDFELRDTRVRITVVCPGYTRTDSPKRLGFTEDNVPRMLWKNPEDVVDLALRAAARGKRVVYPGLLNRFGALIGQYLPRPIVLRFVDNNFDPARRQRAGTS
jgi:short-subunit dehydrogenase